MADPETVTCLQVKNLSTKDIVIQLGEAGGFRIGNITLKSGIVSPIYVDLRNLVTYPRLMTSVADAMYRKAKSAGVEFDLVCGVPYTALPIASVMSALHDVPMIMKRQKAKAYGTGKLLEGNFKPGQRVLVVEDVIASGASIIETVIGLRKEGLIATDVVLLMDRQQQGVKNLAELGLTVHSLVKFDQAMDYLVEDGRFLTPEKREEVKQWLKDHPAPLDQALIQQLKEASVNGGS